MSQFKTRALTAMLRGFARMRPATRQRAGALVGWLSYRLARSRVRIVRRNLELCFPGQPEAVRERWTREHFRALGQSIVDRGVLWYGSPEAVREMVTQTGAERINALIAAGRPVILLAPHFVALDAAATRLTMEVPSGATMYTPQSDPAVDAIVRAGRARFNEVFLVSRKDGVRDLVRHLREPRPVYYLPDMDFGRAGSIFVPFRRAGRDPAGHRPAGAQMECRGAAHSRLLGSAHRALSRGSPAGTARLPGRRFAGRRHDAPEPRTGVLGAALPQPVLLGAPPLQDAPAGQAQAVLKRRPSWASRGFPRRNG